MELTDIRLAYVDIVLVDVVKIHFKSVKYVVGEKLNCHRVF